MRYVGSELSECLNVPFTSAACVIVSGDGINLCGHALLYASGYYYHVAGVYDRPRYMSEQGYRRYLAEAGKAELGRYPRHLTRPGAAYSKLQQLMSARWLWGVLPNNCIVFVEQVLQAGGATNFGLYSNCPVMMLSQAGWQGMLEGMRGKAVDPAITAYFTSVPRVAPSNDLELTRRVAR
jgi:hypothetical protein